MEDLAASRSLSPVVATASIAASSARALVAAADVTMEPVSAALPPRPAATAPSAPAQDSAGASYHPGISLDNQWSSAQNDSAAAAAAAASAMYNSSYYGQHQAAPAFSQRPQRPLHDIVSSMQGSFHFLQESQIELESMCIELNSPFVFLAIILDFNSLNKNNNIIVHICTSIPASSIVMVMVPI